MTTKVKKENSTTAKIKELTGVKPDKISEEQLVKLQAVVKDINLMHHEVGVVAAKKHSMIHNLVQQQNVLLDLQKVFEDEYGTLDIDINDGSIRYEDGEINKED